MGLEFGALGKLEVEDQNIQLPLRRHGSVQLAQAARCGVSRIGKEALALCLPCGVELLEHLPGHEHLAPHDETVGRVFNVHGDGTDGLEVLRHVLPRNAVAPGRAADKAAVDIFQGHGEAVHLGFHAVKGLRDGFPELCVKVPDLVLGKHVLQTLQRYLVDVLLKLAQRRATDTLGGRQRRGILGILRLQLLQLPQQAVIFKIRHGWRVQDIILVVGFLQQGGQPRNFFFRIHGSSSMPK